jgi:RNA-splicing ligase RtcB
MNEMALTPFAFYGEAVLVPGSMGASSFILAGGSNGSDWSSCQGQAGQRAATDNFKSHLAENLQRELEAASIAVKTFAGKLDFHALRTTYDSLLFESGASVKGRCRWRGIKTRR